MSKKNPQWLIDRAFNFDSTNEKRIFKTLEILNEIKNGIQKYPPQSIDTSIERYERSTQTLFKSYGLIYEKDKISEVGTLFVNQEINFKELTLMQIFKKQYYNNEHHKIRPLIICLIVLLKLEEIDSNISWLDSYDYMHYLIEIDTYDRIDEIIKMIHRDKNKRDREVEDIKDSDIWRNAFISSGLFVEGPSEYKNSFKLNQNERGLINFLVNNHTKSKVLTEKEDWLYSFGSKKTGIYEIIYNLIKAKTSSLTGFNTEVQKDALGYYLIDDLPFRDIDNRIFNTTDSTRGLISNTIIKSFGISADLRGYFKSFSNYKNIVYLVLDDLIKNHDILSEVDNLILIEEEHIKLNANIFAYNPHNRIFYGTPGCGKSHYVNSLYKDYNIVRTVFYPDYTNADFIGQIVPVIDDLGNPSFKFKEGPFTKALVMAYDQPSEPFCLVIEEINRGNAAAIFGEIFQLLDRDQDGFSMFGIFNNEILNYLKKSLDLNGFKNEIKIPSNLAIVATMNTSDQNIYPIDTAFQRRWEMVRIRNSFFKFGLSAQETPEFLDNKDNYVSDKAFQLSKLFIPGTNKTWMQFVNNINKKIVSNVNMRMNSEDKQIGIYFVNESNLVEIEYAEDTQALKLFSEKVLKYIWDDIAKIDPSSWFESCNTFDEVIDNFEKDNLNIFHNISFEKHF